MTTISVTATSITTSVSSPVVSAEATTGTFNVVVSGYGEEVVPNGGLFKRLSDTLTTSEAVSTSQGLGRNIADTLTSSELALLALDMIRGTGDFFAPTSDIFTRVFEANRSVPEVVTTTDITSKGVSKSLPLELQFVSDVSVLSPNKVVPELVTTSDIKSFSIGQSLSETCTTGEVLVLLSSFTRVFSETVPVTELFQPVVQYVRDIADVVVATELSLIGQLVSDTEASTASMADSAFMGVSPRFSDSTSMSEVIALLNSFSRGFTDTPSSSDSTWLSVSKVVGTDTAVASDTSVRLIGGKYNDQAVTTDGGTMNIQGYFASNYAVPGYVGTNYSF